VIGGDWIRGSGWAPLDGGGVTDPAAGHQVRPRETVVGDVGEAALRRVSVHISSSSRQAAAVWPRGMSTSSS